MSVIPVDFVGLSAFQSAVGVNMFYVRLALVIIKCRLLAVVIRWENIGKRIVKLKFAVNRRVESSAAPLVKCSIGERVARNRRQAVVSIVVWKPIRRILGRTETFLSQILNIDVHARNYRHAAHFSTQHTIFIVISAEHGIKQLGLVA